MERNAKIEDLAIIDLFAGPGGLGEGFSAAGAEGEPRMRICLSIEKENFAVQTLRLRAFLRSFENGFPQEYYEALNRGLPFPEWGDTHSDNWKHALEEVRQLELGRPGVFEEIAGILDDIRHRYEGNTILIGGPPCQAYSLAGRSRNKGNLNYIPEKDDRHFLYQEYVRILDRLRPAAFVMENVKGMLSSMVHGGAIFERILEDLHSAGEGYHLLPLAAAPASSDETSPARDFLVRSEKHGIPQSRHRVFIVGLRRDLSTRLDLSYRLLMTRDPGPATCVEAIFGGLPPVRSGLSRHDSPEAWAETILGQADSLIACRTIPGDIRAEIVELRKNGLAVLRERSGISPVPSSNRMDPKLTAWLDDPNLDRILQHETRGHMPGDLGRYLFASTFAKVRRISPRLSEFPEFLQPAHANRESGAFTDRFRVQLWHRPASTVTSHVSKDGHYFIHPDPLQCRSLTVREVARLQTFPDNYIFCGPRTEQYKQVGNAVPPYLARQIALAVRSLVAGGRVTPR